MRFRRSAKNSSKKPAAEGTTRASASALNRFWWVGLIGTALVAALAWGVGVLFWMETEKANIAHQITICNATLVRDLGDRAAELRDKLRDWAVDPQLQEFFRAKDAGILGAEEELLTRLIPGVLRVRLLLPGYAGDDQTKGSPSPMSYAGVDLVQQAERSGQVTQMEAHRVGREDMHLALAGPVLDDADGTVLGMIHVTLPASFLPPLHEAREGHTYTLYQQRVGNAVVNIDPERQGGPPAGEPFSSAVIPGTRLQVVSWITQDGIFGADLLLILLCGYVVAVVLFGVALWIPLRGARRALAGDYAGLVAMAEDAAAGRAIRRVSCKLAETQPVAEVVGLILADLVRSQGSGRADTRPPPLARRKPSAMADFGEGAMEPAASTETDEAGRGGEPETQLAEEAVPVPESGRPPAAFGSLDLGGIELHELPPESGENGENSEETEPLGNVPRRIFRSYDIRGVVGVDLTPAMSRYLGLAVGTEVVESGNRQVFVARDTRPSGIALGKALIQGLRDTGCDVVDLGVVPTPLLYYATRYEGDASGVMVTASHNPPDYNGFKVVMGGVTLGGERIAALRDRMLRGGFSRGDGGYEIEELVGTYIARVEKDVAIARSLRLVVDCGNGAASVVAGGLYRALDCEVIEVDCDPQAGFPAGRVPDPTREENLETLRRTVVEEQADLGLAFDGDGDRLGVVDSSGKIIWTDRVLMLLAADVLSRHPGTDVVFDVKCSHHLAREILRNSGRPVMWRSGHSPLKAKLAETGALLAGEWTGHILFQERWFGFDDALYAGARLLEIVALDPRPTAEIFAALPEAITTPELFVPMPEGEPAKLVSAVSELAQDLKGANVQRIDGVRLEFERGWGLVRASNTQPALVFRFEADDEATLDELKTLFRKLVTRAAPGIDLPF
jgi:phosphomannomutase/phosphoglucomutase